MDGHRAVIPDFHPPVIPVKAGIQRLESENGGVEI